MDFFRLATLLIQTFGVYAFGSLSLAWLRERRRPGACLPRQADYVGGAILINCFLWFLVGLSLTLLPRQSFRDAWNILQSIQLVQTFLFPAMIMHIQYVGQRYPEPRLKHVGWTLAIWCSYAVGLSLVVILLLHFYGPLQIIPRGWRGPFVGLGIGGLFAITGIYSLLALMRGKKKRETTAERSVRRGHVGLYALLIPLALLIIVVQFLPGQTQVRVLQLITSSMPLAFIFVGTYHESRFEFFDLFIRRGLSLLLTIIALTGFFAVALPVLESFDLGPIRPWVYAVLLLPLAMSLPWVYRKLGGLLDHWWLGRLFTPVEAVKHFLSGLQNATNEPELVERAERGLTEIFQAPTSIDLEPGVPTNLDFEVVQEIPIDSEDATVGAIRMGRRESQVPYFGEDVTLLRSLADVFFYMLQNIRLQKKKKELSLDASRSELKALRAQINPHFLFNALNAIASLIHKDPVRADQTVEQLAEVFRYTLRGSQSEWTLLDDEMEFVRSYLDVEQARFGKRLCVRVSVGEEVKTARIPTMMVQTLVENAVKHGVSQVRGPVTIEIEAHRRDDLLVIEVADSGPGPGGPGSEPARSRARKSSGYGLKNIRQRLAGHYGDRAGLELRREEGRALTVACIKLPLKRDETHGVA